ncbi:peptidoglycan bridge formation glycyltransferase FemA/FemB family protein [Patescibacteria group bacterium]|nr:peptidoglycan bridge formation glycyltransferase FemA/FemB family protein [Patescibacteria group bacterium]
MPNFHIKTIDNATVWDDFIARQEYTLMTQSWEYGEFYKEQGEQSYFFGIYEQEALIGGALVVSIHAKRGNFLFLPYGPVGNLSQEAFTLFFDYIKNFGKKEGYHFVRVSPFHDVDKATQYTTYGFRHAPLHMLAETTWLLDVRPSSDDLMKAMNKNHRNLIRRCDRFDVMVKVSTDVKDLDAFNQLHDETAKRHKFVRFSDDYIKKEFLAFAEKKEAVVFQAYLPDGRLDAAAVVYYYKHMAAYRHGASIMQYKKHPTSYAIQWAAIQEAKKRGMTYYNFWGIAPNGARKLHPFLGITHFKKGFGGEEKNLIPCQDLPLSYRYWFTWGIETLRRIKRGF